MKLIGSLGSGVEKREVVRGEERRRKGSERGRRGGTVLFIASQVYLAVAR